MLKYVYICPSFTSKRSNRHRDSLKVTPATFYPGKIKLFIMKFSSRAKPGRVSSKQNTHHHNSDPSTHIADHIDGRLLLSWVDGHTDRHIHSSRPADQCKYPLINYTLTSGERRFLTFSKLLLSTLILK